MDGETTKTLKAVARTPSATRYWTPFVGTKNVEIVNAKAKYEKKPNCRVLGQLSSNSLAFMHAEETLIINGHGKADSFFLSETRDGSGRRMHLDVLAQWLVYANLPKDHLRIRILGCETEIFAKFLAIRLGKSYPRIAVGGYKYAIMIGSGHRALVWVPGRGGFPRPNTTGSGNVVWYNNQGKAVDKPAGKLHDLMYDPYLDTIDET